MPVLAISEKDRNILSNLLKNIYMIFQCLGKSSAINSAEKRKAGPNKQKMFVLCTSTTAIMSVCS